MDTSTSLETKRDQLQSKCVQALKDEHKIEMQMEALQKKLKSLRRHGKSLQLTASEKKVATEDAFLGYAEVACREFCETVYKTFPREIRDIIYGHIMDCQEVRIVEPCKNEWGYRHKHEYFETSSETNLRCGSGASLDHWWNPTFVGAEMVQEIGENYYRSASFQFENFGLITKFRVTDQWQLGFLPVVFVSKVEVCINCFDYNFDFNSICGADTHDGWNTTGFGADGSWDEGTFFPNNPRSGLLAELESLFGFRPGTALTIKAELSHPKRSQQLERQEWMCENIIPFIFPTMQRLAEAGYRVRVVLFGDKTSWVPVPFTSETNPLSIDNLKKSFREHVEVEQKKLQELLDDAVPEDYFDDAEE